MQYFALATVVALFVFASIVWASPLKTFAALSGTAGLTLSESMALCMQMLASAITTMPLPHLAYAFATAFLLGMNVALLVFYFRMFRSLPTSAAGGILGGATALLGFGCAACGSVFIVSLITALGGAGLVATLPHHGNYFGYAGIVLLSVSAVFLTRAVNKPRVCPI
jgi:hypothetical protein